MLVAPMGNVINTWTEIQQFCCWLMIQYTVEPTMYPYSCILCGVKAMISHILNLNLTKLVCLSMKEISVGNINITWNSDGKQWKHIIGPPTHTDKNKGNFMDSLLDASPLGDMTDGQTIK